MSRFLARLCIPPCLLLAFGTVPAVAEPAARSTLILSINDTYRIEGPYGGSVGGFARVRTLRKQLEAEAPELLLLQAGDLFFPSLLSRTFNGEQMVDGLNRLDGDAAAFDPHLFVTFGNHEFDKSKLADAAIVQARVRESRFTWLDSNIEFVAGTDGAPVIAGPNLVKTHLVTSGGIKVGLFSLTTNVKVPAYAKFLDNETTARQATADLRRQGAEIVIALTHLDLAEDRDILAHLGAAGPDLILGGHEHTIQREDVGGRWICKADSDAASACVVRLKADASGRVTVEPPSYEAMAGNDPPPDPDLAAAATGWIQRHAQIFCAQKNQPATCLDRVMGHTRTPLEAEEEKIRTIETGLGNFITDVMVQVFSDRGAQVAFMNSGSLRLNRDIAKSTNVLQSTDITLRDVEELFEYPSPLRLIKIKGSTLAEVAKHAVSGWSGKGWWLQISGFAFRQDPRTATISDLTLLTAEGPRAVKPDEDILAVTTEYLTNDQADQDGYRMLKPDQVVDQGGDLKGYVLAALAGAGPGGIAPVRQGRICNPADPYPQTAIPCLAVKP